MTPDQIRWLTWGAIQHRPHGAPKWDEPGTAKAIADHCASWDLVIATEHVLAHARDPKARTPFAIKGNPPHTEPQRSPRFPAKAGEDECRIHRGEHASACRGCAADRLAGERHEPSNPAPREESIAAVRAALVANQARATQTTNPRRESAAETEETRDV